VHLGHSSIPVTMERYGYLFPDALEPRADRLDAARATARADPAWSERQTGGVTLPRRRVTQGP